MTTGFKPVTFKRGEVLLKENHSSECAYLIKKGTVDIRKGVRSGKPRSLATAGPGEIIGEFALFDGLPHCAEAVAIEDVTAIAITGEEFGARVASMDPVIRSMVLHMVMCARRLAEMSVPEERAVEWYRWNKDKEKAQKK
jgi:CRP-like cAMP-binding protein